MHAALPPSPCQDTSQLQTGRTSSASHLCPLQYRRGGGDDDPGTDGVDIRGPGRPGITIGGPDGASSRFRAGNPSAAADQSQLAAAVQVITISHNLQCSLLVILAWV